MRPLPALRRADFRISEILSDTGGRFLLRCVGEGGHGALILCLPVDDNSSRNLARCRLALDLARKARCPAVPHAHEVGRSPTYVDLIVDDPGGRLLSALIPASGLRLDQLVEASLAMAIALRQLHRQAILLRDLRPETILISEDWSQAFFPTLDQAAAQAGHGGFMVEGDGLTLYYVAPELTGRIDIAADQRADLYALGATFFHMASGRPPFTGGNAAEIAYAHLATPPPDLEQLRPELPTMFCRIVSRLLQKDPDDRYESTYDLEADLTICAEQFRKSGAIRPFELTHGTATPEFRLSDGFFGRRREIATLVDALEAGTAAGLRTVVTVSGPSGIGKTALVSQLQWSLARSGARLHTGKFDKFRQDQPYSAMIAVVQSMLRAVLRSEPDEILRARTQLQEAMGVHGKLLTDLVPELSAFLGPQPAFDALLPTEAALRFNEVVGRFIRVFATRQYPLIVFIDDLQWADRASASLLVSIANMAGLSYFMLVLGYRSDELTRLNPAHAAIMELTRTAEWTADIALAELAIEDLAAFVADTLRRDDAQTRALAAIIHKISEGNIFFAREHMQFLAESGVLWFNDEAGAWSFDTEAILASPPPAGTASMLARRLQDLPPGTLSLLDTASCIGSDFDILTLMQVHRMSGSEIAASLAPAVELSIILPLGEQHRLLAALAGLGDGGAAAADSQFDNASYRFRHDQVRAVVHERLDAARRAQLHLRIGNLMYEATPVPDLPKKAVEIFRHYVWSAAEMTTPEERQRCSSLGLLAGTTSIAGLAFDSGRQYLEIADAALGEQAWDVDPGTKRQVQLALAECALALNDWETLEAISSDFARHISDPIALGQMAGLRIRKMSTESQFNAATDLCIETFRRFGLMLPRRPKTPHVLAAVFGLFVAQGHRDVRSFADLDDAKDPNVRAIVQLLNQSIAAAYFAEPNLLPLIAIAAARLSIKHGLSPSSPYALAVVGFVLSGALGMLERGYLHGVAAMQMALRFGESDQAHALFVFNVFLRHIKEPWPEVVEHLANGWSRSLAAGDQEDATYTGGVLFFTHFLSGKPLSVDLTYPDIVAYLGRVRMPHVKPGFDSWLQLLKVMREDTMPADLSGDIFDYGPQTETFKAQSNAVLIAFSSVPAGILDHLAGRTARAEQRFALAKANEPGMFALVLIPALEFFRARNAFLLARSEPHRSRGLQRMARRLTAKIRKRAQSNPSAFMPLVKLLEAEQCFARGDLAAALLELHRVTDLTAVEAPLYAHLAQSRCAEMMRAAGLLHEAVHAARKARKLALDWGSPCLAHMIAAEFGLPEAGSPAFQSGAATQDGVDLRGFVSLVGAIANETNLEALLCRVLGTVLDITNADAGLIALVEEGRVRIRAEADGPRSVTSVSAALDGASAAARRAVGAVITTGKVMQSGDGSGPAFTEPQPKATLCVPIECNGDVLGALYLENKVSRLAFTGSRVQFAQAFASQAGIVLENSRLMVDVDKALKVQTLQAEANRRFVPQQFLAALDVKDIAEVRLNQATMRQTAVVFADLRGFTAIAEKLGPSGTIVMINRYLDHVQPGIAANGGFVVQYYGDGLLAIFPDGAGKALNAVAAMLRGLASYNRTRGDLPELTAGIGVHFGDVLLGVIGDEDHMQCSVIGDAINTASRIQSLTKDFNTTVLVSAEIVSRLDSTHAFQLRSIGPIDVRGKGRPVDLYEALL